MNKGFDMDNVIDYIQPKQTTIEKIPLPAVATSQELKPDALLRETVSQYLEKYMQQFGSEGSKYLYQDILKLIEKPLLLGIMKFTRNNQSRAARLLNLSRGTLRKRLKIHGLL